jgi:hypothetical protein
MIRGFVDLVIYLVNNQIESLIPYGKFNCTLLFSTNIISLTGKSIMRCRVAI